AQEVEVVAEVDPEVAPLWGVAVEEDRLAAEVVAVVLQLSLDVRELGVELVALRLPGGVHPCVLAGGLRGDVSVPSLGGSGSEGPALRRRPGAVRATREW